jgi:hypothetical protein
MFSGAASFEELVAMPDRSTFPLLEVIYGAITGQLEAEATKRLHAACEVMERLATSH